MANPIVRFLSRIFRSNDLVILNGLVALGTTGGQEVFSLLAFQCPCAPVQNFWYGLMATLGPALLLFFISIILNNQTRNLVDGEFVDPSSLTAEKESFPLSHATQILARFPCGESPDNLSGFREEVSRRLKFESQFFGWLLICTVAVVVFLVKCLKACCLKLGYQQEAYRARYLANEKQLFRLTAEAHSLTLAANNVKQFFGFMELNKRNEGLMDKNPQQGTQRSLPWDKITDSSKYQEKPEIPPYSRLHKWAIEQSGINPEFNMTPLLYPQPHGAASPTSDH
ncbi:calcium homeostasis modulator protein 2-like [Sorex araneus]|uniref:calcium homeostasis modulator protein 2-like n=1 Tax=Sorex araneus TaxID=42254 RepID=UPI0024337238|nr:calcium homeostasis modulator protein 2-like [Sorex araneus]